MPTERVGRVPATDNEGYLLDPSDWNEEVAQELARRENLALSAERWAVVRFVRDWFETRQAVPEARHALKAMQTELGRDKATRKYLYQLFRRSTVDTATLDATRPHANISISCFPTATVNRPARSPACASR